MFFRTHSLHPLHVPYNGRHVSRTNPRGVACTHARIRVARTFPNVFRDAHGAGASLSLLVSRSVSRDVARDPRTGLWDYFQILKIICHT